MPSEQQRPSLTGHRSSSSNMIADSPSTPPHHSSKHKGQKHAVGARIHARVSSSKALHKLTKAHGNEGSHTDLKKLAAKGGSSSTNLKKNTSQTSLKRNRSSADVTKRPKSSHGPDKERTGVHFEIGDQEDWEEASSSASPALSRSASAKASANNSEPQSPVQSTKSQATDGGNERQSARHAADGKVIAERLLQRTPSHNTTKMSLATATPMGHSPERMGKSHGSSTHSGTPKNKDGVVSSRFVGGSGTPGEHSPFLADASHNPPHGEDIKRARSMGNLTRQDSNKNEDEEESALAPRSRKSSTSHAYIPPQQSRTQQKL